MRGTNYQLYTFFLAFLGKLQNDFLLKLFSQPDPFSFQEFEKKHIPDLSCSYKKKKGAFGEREIMQLLKLIPQYCIAHPYCARSSRY